MAVTLFGYEHSVYSWVARIALCEKGVPFDLVEVNPFDGSPSRDFLAINPFNRVPALRHGNFTLFETAAITRYIDETFAGPALQPAGIRARAVQNQIISIVDSSCYWPMVRQVFSHRIFRPRLGEPSEKSSIEQGLAESATALAALETIIDDGPFLTGETLSLADIHLHPMLTYFAMAPEAKPILGRHRALSIWHRLMSARPAVAGTAPGLIDWPVI